MKKYHSIGPILSARENLWGIAYLLFQLFVLPNLLYWVNGKLAQPLREAEINFVFYLINFMAMLLLFHDFLGHSMQQLTRHPIEVLQAVILGLAAYYASSFCIMQIIPLLSPGFSNYNDEAIFAMNRGSDFLLLISTVVLVPPVEECLYRGLFFRNLYGKNKWAAYIVSILLFSMIHILGYLGQYSPLEVVMAVLQYLPAGLWLAWSYAKSDTIFAPILMHAAINYITIRTMR